MSDLLIKGMEMPKPGAYTCELGVLDDNTAVLTIYTPINEPQKSYTLIPIPPHGALIDRDALLKKCEFVCTDDDEDIRAVRYSIIENAPTILPAEEV